MAADRFIGWRYLYRRRQSRTVAVLTVLALVAVVATQVAFFKFGHAQIGAIFTVPTMLLFLVFLFLNFFSIFTTVSIIGVILGVAALTVVLSVTSGFQASFKAKVLGVNAHVLVLKYGLDFSEYREVMKKAGAVKHVRAVAPFMFNEMMLARGPALSGVLLKGIDPQLSPKVLDIANCLVEGKMSDLATPMPPNDGGPPLPEIFIGKELQKKLKAKIGDRVRVVSPKAEMDPSQWSATSGGGPKVREFRVAGIFYSGFFEYDGKLAYVNLPEVQAFYQSGDVVSGIEMKLDDVDRATEVANQLTSELGSPYRVIDWRELNHNLFTALLTQKIVLVIVLTIIILVAAFNIVAALTMLVIGKVKEIAILKSMGMRAFSVARVFWVAGMTIGVLGTVAGISLGLLVCRVVERYGYHLDAKVYLIDRLPVQVGMEELALTAAITLLICFLATIYPSLKAAGLRPTDGLRYE